MTRRPWILASASPRRRDILAGLGLPFCIDASALPEPGRDPGEPPARYAVRAARLKAAEVAARHRSGWVVAADTVVVHGDKVMGKPASRADARAMLRNLAGCWHSVITGVCVRNGGTGAIGSTHGLSLVHFRRLTAREIDWYLDTGEHADKAGAYGIQGHAALFIDRLEGCYFNVVGFPVAAFELLCRRMGIDLLSHCGPQPSLLNPT